MLEQSGQPVDAVGREDDCSRDTMGHVRSPRARDAVLWISRYQSTPIPATAAPWPLSSALR